MLEPQLGVVVVTFNSGSEVVDCLETLLAAARTANLALQLVVVDNASSDDTVARIEAWADGRQPYAPPPGLPFAPPAQPKPVALQRGGPDAVPEPATDVLLIQTGANLGFAGGVNVGLESLAQRPGIGHFWILNPDTVVPPDAVAALARWLETPPRYALMGGRVTYMHRPDRIQIDGGTIDWRTGATGNLNLGRSHRETPQPRAEEMAFVMGGNMIASRAFYECAGPMAEDYFLYYEEVDWALRRGDLPLAICEGLRVYHHAGSAIGSPGGGRQASPLSLYFKHRGRMMFLRRFRRRSLPTGYLYTLAIAARLMWRRRWLEAQAVLSGGFGLAAPAAVAERLGPAVLSRLGATSAAN